MFKSISTATSAVHRSINFSKSGLKILAGCTQSGRSPYLLYVRSQFKTFVT
jgi:hypothetical protein